MFFLNRVGSATLTPLNSNYHPQQTDHSRGSHTFANQNIKGWITLFNKLNKKIFYIFLYFLFYKLVLCLVVLLFLFYCYNEISFSQVKPF